MKIHCPNCETLYDIDEATLASVDYTAVCCKCHQVFTAEKPGGSTAPAASPPDAEAQEDPLAQWDEILGIEVESSTPAAPEPTPSLASDVPEDFTSLAAAELPEYHISKPRQPKNKPRLMLTTGILAFTLLAAAQFAWINKQQLLEHPQGRQLMQRFCDLADCELEQQKATDKFTILHRNLQPSISHQHALSFTLSFTNDADFSQQMPRLQISLLDNEEQLLAQRSFSPDEYLYPATGNDRSMKPKEIVNVELLFQNQGLDASGFQLEFL